MREKRQLLIGDNSADLPVFTASDYGYRPVGKEILLAAEALITSGQCTVSDFADVGGFTKSTSEGAGIYFTYCGGGSDRIYLDVATGRTYR